MNKTQLQVITRINQTGDIPELKILHFSQQNQQYDEIHTELRTSFSFPSAWRQAAPFPAHHHLYEQPQHLPSPWTSS